MLPHAAPSFTHPQKPWLLDYLSLDVPALLYACSLAPSSVHLQEPWLLEYLSLDMPGAMTAAGFLPPRQLENSPRHKTVVAVKPQQ